MNLLKYSILLINKYKVKIYNPYIYYLLNFKVNQPLFYFYYQMDENKKEYFNTLNYLLNIIFSLLNIFVNNNTAKVI